MNCEQLFGSEILEFFQQATHNSDGGGNIDNDEIDRLLAAASESYESFTPQPETAPPLTQQPGHNTTPAHSIRFAQPQTDEEIERARQKAVPAKTVADTKYCVRLFNEWRTHRIQTTEATIPTLTQMTKQHLNYWLTRFVLEVRKKCGNVYPPNTLHHIVMGLMRHLRWSGQPSIDFLKDPEFAQFRSSLDAEMKRLQQEGVGSIKRQAETLSEAEEDNLWAMGLLGDHSPQTLLDTMVFYTGYYFALRSGR